jgi:hypothetical protein
VAAVEGRDRAGELRARRRTRRVTVFELDSVASAQRYVDDFPLSKAGLLEWSFIPLTDPLPVESLFAAGVDVGEPLDRTQTPG